eukprot:TRINITY_DN6763_c0_g1_i1.p1 TRINITY_DN6763_c0_g1~~TRINITY_DN6763_c0_g1_i1.p1  ORF type:complete len:314 (+),score=46.61 TRINITY_DN6763_c0_g1_i1:63-944(+)
MYAALGGIIILAGVMYGIMHKKAPAEPSIVKEIMERRRQRRARQQEKVDQYLLQYENNLASSSYDPINNPAVTRFNSEIMRHTPCSFAKRAHIWACALDPAGPRKGPGLEDQVMACIPTVVNFTVECDEHHLDGIVFEIKGEEYFNTLEVFGDTVRRVLTCLSSHDPWEEDCIKDPYLDRRGWRYQFNDTYIFVTTFCPLYPPHHARHQFDIKDRCYILLQPETSFGHHDIGADHPWDDSLLSTSVRQRIRHAYKDRGMEYHVPKARFYPMAPMIVPGLEMNDPGVTWWVPHE